MGVRPASNNEDALLNGVTDCPSTTTDPVGQVPG